MSNQHIGLMGVRLTNQPNVLAVSSLSVELTNQDSPADCQLAAVNTNDTRLIQTNSSINEASEILQVVEPSLIDPPSPPVVETHGQQDIPRHIVSSIEINTLNGQRHLIDIDHLQSQLPLWQVARDIIAPALDVSQPQLLFKSFIIRFKINHSTYLQLDNESRFTPLQDIIQPDTGIIACFAVRRLTSSCSISCNKTKLCCSSAPLSPECSICGEDFSTRSILQRSLSHTSEENDYLYGYVLSCGHRFCYPCIQEWFKRSKNDLDIASCPNCRRQSSTSFIESLLVGAHILAHEDLKQQHLQKIHHPLYMNVQHHLDLLRLQCTEEFDL